MDLKGKVCVVTGGASGIGLATVKAFLQKGSKVVVADYNQKALNKVEEELKNQSDNLLFVNVNVADEPSVEKLIKKTVETFGKVDVMVNNAGIAVMSATHELTYEDYRKVISVNQDGVFFGSKYAIREMLKTGGGTIINTASILGVVGQAGTFAYNASKGAINILTKSLALEYAEQNIRVNSICPGYVESGMVSKEALGDFYDNLVAKHPIGRIGKPEEIAHGMVFLAENEFVTGLNLLIDGGYTAQ